MRACVRGATQQQQQTAAKSEDDVEIRRTHSLNDLNTSVETQLSSVVPRIRLVQGVTAGMVCYAVGFGSAYAPAQLKRTCNEPCNASRLHQR
jgi:hypothetical protein